MRNTTIIIGILQLLVFLPFISGCSTDKAQLPDGSDQTDLPASTADSYYRTLGDIYTIGVSVAYENNFPSQLSVSLGRQPGLVTDLDILATTGWRTDQLPDTMGEGLPRQEYGLVTLLIRAIRLAGGKKERVLVVSITDYSYTPYGERTDGANVSEEIDRYNLFALETAQA